ncbi:unnamed protein product [Choristocarpus tenellus]
MLSSAGFLVQSGWYDMPTEITVDGVYGTSCSVWRCISCNIILLHQLPTSKLAESGKFPNKLAKKRGKKRRKTNVSFEKEKTSLLRELIRFFLLTLILYNPKPNQDRCHRQNSHLFFFFAMQEKYHSENVLWLGDIL